jgi:hypothetical protein
MRGIFLSISVRFHPYLHSVCRDFFSDLVLEFGGTEPLNSQFIVVWIKSI